MRVILLLAGLLIVFCVVRFRNRKATKSKTARKNSKQQQEALDEFKRRAEKIRVPLRECEVISNSHTEEMLRSHNYRVQALDSLYDDGSSNIRKVNITQSRILFEAKNGTEEITYASPVIGMDRTTLLLKLDLQNETTLYVDRSDAGKFYFDLEFLKL